MEVPFHKNVQLNVSRNEDFIVKYFSSMRHFVVVVLDSTHNVGCSLGSAYNESGYNE